ncbi:MAG TPA: hypothetical protein VMZ26_13940 [Pyrinomonadaceae bacterium]|nr:hypothetical protein [Pyrinomonadaceae bacterium]
MIKVIKRKEPEVEVPASVESPPTQTITETVAEWVMANRQNRLDHENQSRRTIADWAKTKI